MPTFIVEQFELWTSKAEVEATSYVEAIKKWKEGRIKSIFVSEFIDIYEGEGVTLYDAFKKNPPIERLGFDTMEDLSMITENVPGLAGISVKERNGRKKS